MSDRVYPLAHPEPSRDARFSYGLIWDVMAVLAAHGYPNSRNGADHAELHLMLQRFIYGPTTPDSGPEPSGGDAA